MAKKFISQDKKESFQDEKWLYFLYTGIFELKDD